MSALLSGTGLTRSYGVTPALRGAASAWRPRVSPGTLTRLAVAGSRTDVLRTVLTALLLGLAVGDALVRLIGTTVEVGGSFGSCVGTGDETCVPEVVHPPEVTLSVPIPWGHLSLLGGGALLAVLAAVGAGLLVLRSSTDLEELRVG